MPGGIFDFLLILTPQSIAKPSPGWNKVALLTAVRNPPCSCPFSVSLHPPLAALNSEPRPGRLFIANQKLSPRAGKVARSAERGAAKNSRMPRVIPPQLRLRSAAPPFHGGAFGCSTNSAYSAVPLRGAIVSMGLRGVQGGLRGEIEIFPGPPAKKVIKMLICYLFVSTPQSIAKPSPGWNKVALLTAVRNSPCSCPFSVSLHPPLAALNSEPRPGSLLVRFISSHIKPALKGEVDMSVSEWTEGLYRGYRCLRQPLSQSALRA